MAKLLNYILGFFHILTGDRRVNVGETEILEERVEQSSLLLPGIPTGSPTTIEELLGWKLKPKKPQLTAVQITANEQPSYGAKMWEGMVEVEPQVFLESQKVLEYWRIKGEMQFKIARQRSPQELALINERLNQIFSNDSGTEIKHEKPSRQKKPQELSEIWHLLRDIYNPTTTLFVRYVPSVLTYRNTHKGAHLDNYLKKLQVIVQLTHSKFGYDVPPQFDWRKKPTSFATLDSLSRLEAKLRNFENGDGEEEIDYSNLRPWDYIILRKDNGLSRKYLDSLIRNGYVTVSTDEHWKKSTTGDSGLRGSDILQRIRRELTQIFARFELPGPEFTYSQKRLGINDQTRILLGELREITYRMQK